MKIEIHAFFFSGFFQVLYKYIAENWQVNISFEVFPTSSVYNNVTNM